MLPSTRLLPDFLASSSRDATYLPSQPCSAERLHTATHHALQIQHVDRGWWLPQHFWAVFGLHAEAWRSVFSCFIPSWSAKPSLWVVGSSISFFKVVWLLDKLTLFLLQHRGWQMAGVWWGWVHSWETRSAFWSAFLVDGDDCWCVEKWSSPWLRCNPSNTLDKQISSEGGGSGSRWRSIRGFMVSANCWCFVGSLRSILKASWH